MADTEGAAQQEIEKQGIHLLWACAYATFTYMQPGLQKCVR